MALVMSGPDPLTIALLSTGGALLGSVIGAFATLRVSLRNHRLDRSKLISQWSRSEELERARVGAYRGLWQCLGGISTKDKAEIVRNLPKVQTDLQKWYYDAGGGLFLSGAAENPGSAKAAFFAARDLQSNDAYEIWQAFHRLRQGVRRDLGVYESDADEDSAIEAVKKKLQDFEK
jgi:hypothetical protein